MAKKRNTLYAVLSGVWLIILLSLATFDYLRLSSQEKIQFDLLALLPESHTENMNDINLFMKDINLSSRVLILVGHPDPAIAKATFGHLHSELASIEAPFKEQATSLIGEQYKQFLGKLYPHRAGFLAKEDRDCLVKGKADLLFKRAFSEIVLPFSSLGTVNIKGDPFFLYPSFIKSIQPPIPFQTDENGDLSIQAEGKSWYVYQAHLLQPTFSLKALEAISDKVLPILDRIQQEDQVEILKTGAVFYAAIGSKQANAEIFWIGLISTLGISLLLLSFFRSFRPLTFAVLIICSGIVGGIFACLALFGTIHIIALVFGCTLVGITVDYALHYCCASYRKDASMITDRFQILKSLIPALPLGVLSSSLGYGLLFLVPFPGIQQMAILACTGLIFAFISVCLWGPYFIKPSSQDIPVFALRFQKGLEKLADLGLKRHCKLILSLAALATFLIGSLSLEFDDDVRNFQSLDTQLKGEEVRIKSMMRTDTSSTFLTIRGHTPNEVLKQSERIIPTLEKMRQDHLISNYRSLTDLIPSIERQEDNRALINEQLYQQRWPSFAQMLEIEQDTITQDFDLNAPLFELDHHTLEMLPEGWRGLIHWSEKGPVIGRILLNDIHNAQPLQDLAREYEGVQYVDPVQEYSGLFTTYRYVFMGLLLGIFIGIAVFLTLRQGAKAMLAIVSPVVLSLLISIGILGLSHIPFTLFHAMGFILVLCIGIDYSLFLYFRQPANGPTTTHHLLLLANGLAAVTTLLSFGLLSLSKTGAPHDFGIAVSIGITLCFGITTLLLGKGHT